MLAKVVIPAQAAIRGYRSVACSWTRAFAAVTELG